MLAAAGRASVFQRTTQETRKGPQRVNAGNPYDVSSYESGGQGTRTDSRSVLPANDLGKPGNQFGTESGTLQDETGSLPPDLAIVVNAWPHLTEADRKRMLAIVKEVV